MHEATDMDLVREYVQNHSETAFAELVRKHIPLVYSVALRFTGSPPDAEDVTQAVFVILARKAASLRAGTILTGWFYETTRFVALRWLRTQTRRHYHQQEAYMQSNLSGGDDVWRQIAPHLEDAMSRLNEQDRTLLALRFYENKTGAEAAQLLRIGAEAAHKRTARALEKLRAFFAKRGIVSTSTAIGETLAANSIQAVPAGLAAIISTAALSATKTTTILAVAKTMTLLQKAFATTTTVAAVGAVIYALHVTQSHHGNGVHMPVAAQRQPASSPIVQVHIKARFYSISDRNWQSLGITWTADSQGNRMSYLKSPQLKNILKTLNGAGDISVLAEPEVITSNGRQTQMRNGSLANFDETLDIVPYYSTNSSTFNLPFNIGLKQLTGDPSQPTVQSIFITNTVTFADGNALVLEHPIPAGSWLSSDNRNLSTLSRPRALLIFVTADPVDEAGNRIRHQ